MPDADIVAAIIAGIIAIVGLAWGIVRHLRADSNVLEIETVTQDDRDFMSDAARRYHEDNRLGRN